MRTHPKLPPKWRLASIATGQSLIKRDVESCNVRVSVRVVCTADKISGRFRLCRVLVVHWSLVHEIAVRQSVLSSL